MVKILDKWAEGKDAVEDYKATLLAIQCRDELNLKGIVLMQATILSLSILENKIDELISSMSKKFR